MNTFDLKFEEKKVKSQTHEVFFFQFQFTPNKFVCSAFYSIHDFSKGFLLRQCFAPNDPCILQCLSFLYGLLVLQCFTPNDLGNEEPSRVAVARQYLITPRLIHYKQNPNYNTKD